MAQQNKELKNCIWSFRLDLVEGLKPNPRRMKVQGKEKRATTTAWLRLAVVRGGRITTKKEVVVQHDASSSIFTTLGKAFCAFNIYTFPALEPPKAYKEIKITDGHSVNFNGHFPSSSSSSFLLNLIGIRVRNDSPPLQVIYDGKKVMKRRGKIVWFRGKLSLVRL